MKAKWRWLVLVVLLLGPVLFMVGLGGWYLWSTGWWIWAWWPLSASIALAIFLAYRWQSGRKLLTVETEVPTHWTDRDNQAWKLVLARAEAGSAIDPDRLISFEFYTETAQEMALEISRYYHPGSREPMGRVTIPELLAVVELASHDLAEMVDEYLPAGHLLTVNDWKRARQAADWYQTASDVTWAIASVFAPFKTGMRYLASQAGIAKPWQKLQQNLVLWFYTAYIHRLGNYLIELNSGRLRVGASRYRELTGKAMMGSVDTSASPGPDGQPVQPAVQAAEKIKIVILGQSKAGKSSLVNALLGDRLAQTSIVRATTEITRYELESPGLGSKLVIADTVGYAHAGPREDQKEVTFKAAQEADLVFLVMHALNPGRQADADMLAAYQKYFADHPEQKQPPLIGVLTHIDLLSPSLEWKPPYDWRSPVRPKERSISEAVISTNSSMGGSLITIPVCVAPDKAYGIEEWLLPAMAEKLDEARGVALVRCLHAEADRDKVKRIFKQLLASGKAAAQIFLTLPQHRGAK